MAIRIHTEANERDGTFAQALNLENPRRKVYVDRVPAISEHDIVAFYPLKSADGYSYGAEFQLDRHGQITLSSISNQSIGGMLLVIVNGRVITPLTIDRPIEDGIFVIPFGLTPQEISSIAHFYPIIGSAEGTKPGKMPEAR